MINWKWEEKISKKIKKVAIMQESDASTLRVLLGGNRMGETLVRQYGD